MKRDPLNTLAADPVAPSGTDPIRTLAAARVAAEAAAPGIRAYLANEAHRDGISVGLRIRAVESCLYDLFGKGRLHGTIHTCLGQEFSGVLAARRLRPGDFVTSNHRCHGHFISACGNWRGLIDEIVGNQEGVCAGIGSSQHLWAENFMSNGQQGGMLPVAAGIALDRKQKASRNVVLSFIGEGTLGEGVVYETLNLASLWRLPHVVICENNFYSQSTEQHKSVAGDIEARAAAFGVATFHADTWNLAALDETLNRAIESARETSTPSFVVVATYRLNPHSKGDDLRDREEIDWFRAHDPLTIATTEIPRWRTAYADIEAETTAYGAAALDKAALAPERFFGDQLPVFTGAEGDADFSQAAPPEDGAARVVQQLNAFYRETLRDDPVAFFLGEDIEDPYGGAFKVAKGLTTEFPDRALTTPISEAAITGVGIGLALCGRRSFVEIMFGDFITYAFDQIVNNASKFHHMYNRNVTCPVVVRAPMGGRRGYGPTHSQSLERFLIGIDNCCTVSLNSLTDVAGQLAALKTIECPAIVLENKVDYTLKTFVPETGYVVERHGSGFPTTRVRSEYATSHVTLIGFGGMARFIADHILDIFTETDMVPELLVPTLIHPLDMRPIVESTRRTRRVAVFEEGALFGSLGAELLARLSETMDTPFQAIRVGGKPVPIPSAPALEAGALPDLQDIFAAIAKLAEPT